MAIIRIEDAGDPRIDAYLRLSDHQLRNRLDPARALAIAESRLVIEVALERKLDVVSLLIDERHLEGMAELLDGLAPEVPVYVATRELMSSIVGFEVTRGYLAALRRPAERELGEVLVGARRAVVLEGIVDVSNVGALFRSAAALGADAVLLAPGCADPLSRRALRVSMGCVLKLPWARLPQPWPDASVSLLHEQGFRCVALALREDALRLDDPSLKQIDRLALFLGTEGSGLTGRAIGACDMSVVIPMSHGVDSLNVAAAGAIALWELRTS